MQRILFVGQTGELGGAELVMSHATFATERMWRCCRMALCGSGWSRPG
jgi:hypothetical protein